MFPTRQKSKSPKVLLKKGEAEKTAEASSGKAPQQAGKPPQQAGVQQAGAPGEGDDDIYVNIQEWVPPALQKVGRSW